MGLIRSQRCRIEPSCWNLRLWTSTCCRGLLWVTWGRIRFVFGEGRSFWRPRDGKGRWPLVCGVFGPNAVTFHVRLTVLLRLFDASAIRASDSLRTTVCLGEAWVWRSTSGSENLCGSWTFPRNGRGYGRVCSSRCQLKSSSLIFPSSVQGIPAGLRRGFQVTCQVAAEISCNSSLGLRNRSLRRYCVTSSGLLVFRGRSGTTWGSGLISGSLWFGSHVKSTRNFASRRLGDSDARSTRRLA